MREERRGLKVGCGIGLLLIAVLLIMSALFITKFFGGNLGNLTSGEQGSFVPSADTQTAEEEVVQESDLNDRIYNFLLVGVDTRNMNSYEGRSDSMIVISVNKRAKKIVMCSLLRDTYASIPGYGKRKLNAAYAFGGTSLMNESIANNYGIRIDNTAIVNFKVVVDFIDAVGGVDIDVNPEEISNLNRNIEGQNRILGKPAGSDLISSNGGVTMHLNGNQALGYSRIRYVGTDFARTHRQRIVLQAALDQIKKMSLSQQTALVNQFMPRVHTDLTTGDVLSLGTLYLRKGNMTIDSMSMPIDGSYSNQNINGEAVLVVDFDKNKEAWEKAVS